jgi:hypothetical protein
MQGWWMQPGDFTGAITGKGWIINIDELQNPYS